jgi:cellulose synthase (UDP-forming)
MIASTIGWLLPAHPEARRRLRRHVIRVLVATDVVLGLYYLTWRYTYSINWSVLPFAVALIAAETYSFIDSFLFGLTMWRLKERTEPPPSLPGATVDVFVTCYNEPVELVYRTVRAAKAIASPHRTYLLDDGDSTAMKQMAAEEGVDYITRSSDWGHRPRHAKAGNLSNALMQTDGEFILILDADQVPKPLILERTLGYFRDERVAFVQTPNSSTTCRKVTRSGARHRSSMARSSRVRTAGTQPSSVDRTPSCDVRRYSSSAWSVTSVRCRTALAGCS